MKRPRGRPPHADLLTPSEWRTVFAIQHGMTNAEVARRRGVSVNAVKFHVANALAKLNLRNRRELRAWFRAPKDSALANLGRTTMERIRTRPDRAIARGQRHPGLKPGIAGVGLPHLFTFGTLAFSTAAFCSSC
jgi:DNA-binding CsgD family transcriptional regulator